MAVSDYIPSRDPMLDEWADNFSAKLTASPVLYGLVPAEAAQIRALFDDFHGQFVTAIDPATRTAGAVAAKDATKAQMLQLMRLYAQRIKRNAGLDEDDILALGLHLDDLTKTRREAPATQPLLSIVAATPFQHTLSVRDAAAPNKRAKPFGSKSCLIVGNVIDAVGTDPEEASYMGLLTRWPAVVNYVPADVGKIATLWAAWVGVRGDKGPWSSPASMHVVGGALP